MRNQAQIYSFGKDQHICISSKFFVNQDRVASTKGSTKCIPLCSLYEERSVLNGKQDQATVFLKIPSMAVIQAGKRVLQKL